MKARTVQDIERMALSRGAEAEIHGRAFNTSQERVASKRAEPAPTPRPAPAAAPALTQEDVVRIAAEMLADSERRTAAAIANQASAFTAAIAKALREAMPQPAPGKKMVLQRIKVAYDRDDRITEMTPEYKELEGG